MPHIKMLYIFIFGLDCLEFTLSLTEYGSFLGFSEGNQSSQSFLSKELYIGLIPSFLPLYELASPINAIDNKTNRVSNPLISGMNLRLTPAFHSD